MQLSPYNKNILPQEMPGDINASTHFKRHKAQKKNNASYFHVIEGTDIQVSPKINHMTLRNITPSQNNSDISVCPSKKTSCYEQSVENRNFTVCVCY